MFRVNDELANHRLNDAYVSIERAAKEAAEESHPKVEREAHNKERRNSSKAAKYENWLTTYPVAQSAPPPAIRLARYIERSMSAVQSLHSRDRLRQCEGRNEQPSVEGCIALVADVEVEDKLPGIREY